MRRTTSRGGTSGTGAIIDNSARRRPGRPPRGDVRSRILKAATRQIGALGFEGMTLQSVADEVGVRKPSVLHHFPSKDAIRQAVLVDFWEHWSNVVPRLLQGATEHGDGFEKMMGELVAFFREDPDRARLLIRETLDRPQEFRRLFREYVMPWLVMIGNNIRDGQQRGMCHLELDPEMHLLQILELILISTAWGDIAADGPASAPYESTRHSESLMRIARTSLFMKPFSQPEPGRRKARGERS